MALEGRCLFQDHACSRGNVRSAAVEAPFSLESLPQKAAPSSSTMHHPRPYISSICCYHYFFSHLRGPTPSAFGDVAFWPTLRSAFGKLGKQKEFQVSNERQGLYVGSARLE
ncbi:hypothetical protein ACLOJK_008502 [Asimina triloba]